MPTPHAYAAQKRDHWPAGSDGPLRVPTLSAAEAWARRFSSRRTVTCRDGRIAAINGESRAVLIALARAERAGEGRAVLSLGALKRATGCSSRRLIWLLDLLRQAGACGPAEALAGEGDKTVLQVPLLRDRGL